MGQAILLEHIWVPSLEAAATTLNLDVRLSKRDDEPLLRSAHCARRVPRIAIKAIGRDTHYVTYVHYVCNFDSTSKGRSVGSPDCNRQYMRQDQCRPHRLPL